MKIFFKLLIIISVFIFATGCSNVSDTFFLSVSFEEYDLNFVDCERALVVPFALKDDVALDEISIMQINGNNLNKIDFDYQIYKNEEYKDYMRYDITFRFNGCLEDVEKINITNISLNIQDDVYSFDPKIGITNLSGSALGDLEPLMEPLGVFKPSEGNPHNIQFSYSLNENLVITDIYYLVDLHTVDSIVVNELSIDEVRENEYFENENIYIEIILNDIDYTLDFGRLVIEYKIENQEYVYYSSYNVDTGDFSGNLVIEKIDLENG